VGAGVGALGTYIWSQNMERQKREMERATQGTGIAVTRTADNPLSMDRAASTRSYLTGRGVDGRRIAIDGMGERYPIATNDSADGRARNRRVEIFVGERPRG
jgi:outer membrane protein OmpA-like peptidoglycan-associated protein